MYHLKLSQVHGWFTAAYSMSAITVSPRRPLTLRFCHFVMVWRGHSQANFTRVWVRVRSTHRHSTIIRPRVWCNPSPLQWTCSLDSIGAIWSLTVDYWCSLLLKWWCYSKYNWKSSYAMGVIYRRETLHSDSELLLFLTVWINTHWTWRHVNCNLLHYI